MDKRLNEKIQKTMESNILKNRELCLSELEKKKAEKMNQLQANRNNKNDSLIQTCLLFIEAANHQSIIAKKEHLLKIILKDLSKENIERLLKENETKVAQPENISGLAPQKKEIIKEFFQNLNGNNAYFSKLIRLHLFFLESFENLTTCDDESFTKYWSDLLYILSIIDLQKGRKSPLYKTKELIKTIQKNTSNIKDNIKDAYKNNNMFRYAMLNTMHNSLRNNDDPIVYVEKSLFDLDIFLEQLLASLNEITKTGRSKRNNSPLIIINRLGNIYKLLTNKNPAIKTYDSRLSVKRKNAFNIVLIKFFNINDKLYEFPKKTPFNKEVFYENKFTAWFKFDISFQILKDSKKILLTEVPFPKTYSYLFSA